MTGSPGLPVGLPGTVGSDGAQFLGLYLRVVEVELLDRPQVLLGLVDLPGLVVTNVSIAPPGERGKIGVGSRTRRSVDDDFDGFLVAVGRSLGPALALLPEERADDGQGHPGAPVGEVQRVARCRRASRRACRRPVASTKRAVAGRWDGRSCTARRKSRLTVVCRPYATVGHAPLSRFPDTGDDCSSQPSSVVTGPSKLRMMAWERSPKTAFPVGERFLPVRNTWSVSCFSALWRMRSASVSESPTRAATAFQSTSRPSSVSSSVSSARWRRLSRTARSLYVVCSPFPAASRVSRLSSYSPASSAPVRRGGRQRRRRTRPLRGYPLPVLARLENHECSFHGLVSGS